MADNTYKVTEIVGTSTEDVSTAIRNGIATANRTIRNLDWFEVTEIRGHLQDGEVAHFQVGLKVGFRIDE
jgi:dodecin